MKIAVMMYGVICSSVFMFLIYRLKVILSRDYFTQFFLGEMFLHHVAENNRAVVIPHLGCPFVVLEFLKVGVELFNRFLFHVFKIVPNLENVQIFF